MLEGNVETKSTREQEKNEEETYSSEVESNERLK